MPTLDAITQTVATEPAVMLYFSAPSCNVCHALRPKLFTMIAQHFPKIRMLHIDISEESDTAAAFQVFSIPTVLIFFEGNEYLRKSRYMSVHEVEKQLRRPYTLLYS